MEWTADFKCACGYVDEDRSFTAPNREEALEATLPCPNCDEDNGLRVIEETLRESRG